MEGKCICATDGSHDRTLNRALDSWVIATKDGKHRAVGSCPCDGDFITLNSYRAELEVVRSLLYWLRLLVKVKHCCLPDNFQIPLWMDNKQALRKSRARPLTTPRAATNADEDIVADIWYVRQQLGLIFDGRHVKAHQTKTKGKRLEVTLNELVDEHAKNFLRHPAR